MPIDMVQRNALRMIFHDGEDHDINFSQRNMDAVRPIATGFKCVTANVLEVIQVAPKNPEDLDVFDLHMKWLTKAPSMQRPGRSGLGGFKAQYDLELRMSKVEDDAIWMDSEVIDVASAMEEGEFRTNSGLGGVYDRRLVVPLHAGQLTVLLSNK